MIRPRYQLLLGFGLLVAALVVACQDEPVSPQGPGSISLEIVLADDSLDGPGLMAATEEGRTLLFGSLDRARAYARGPTNRTIDLTLTQDDYFEGTITSLQPGSYTVAVEGLTGNEVEYYGETTGVSVSAGQNSTASITFRSFVPNLTTVPTRTASRRFDVCYSSVSNATGYRVEWANNPGFTGLNSAQSSSTCAEVQVSTLGTYYVRVRALHDMSSTPSCPSDSRTVDVVAAAVGVGGTLTGAEELDIRAGGATLDLTLTDDQWVAGIGSDNAETAALLDGIVSSGSEAAGWNAVVAPGLNFTHVSRVSGTVVRITLPEFAAYSISAPETITVTVPATALAESSDAIVAAPTFAIAVSPRLLASVTGDGGVSSNPVGIDCPDTSCSSEYPSGTAVTLTATPAAGWGLQEWTDACTGSGTCEIILVQDTAVGATFVQVNFDLNVTVVGNGGVTSVPAGIDCPGDCVESYPGGTEVTLTADPDPGWLFSQWTGDCSGTNLTTVVTVDAAKSCTAMFALSAAWSMVQVSGPLPLPRKGHSAVYDLQGHRMIVFAGWSSVPYNSLRDTWSLDLTSHTWAEISTTGSLPPNRAGHAAVYDSKRGRMVVFGGSNWWQTSYNDVWALDLATNQWSQLQPVEPNPSARYFHSGVYRPETDEIFVFGGVLGQNLVGNDLWALNLETMEWRQINVSGAAPDPRWGASLILDEANHRLILFGGRDFDRYFNDAWALDLQTNQWSVLPSYQNTVAFHRAVHVTDLNLMIAVAGWGLYSHGQAAAFSTAVDQWLTLSVSGNLPVERQDPSAIWDPIARRLIMFGGDPGLLTQDFNDTWQLSIGG